MRTRRSSREPKTELNLGKSICCRTSGLIEKSFPLFSLFLFRYQIIPAQSAGNDIGSDHRQFSAHRIYLSSFSPCAPHMRSFYEHLVQSWVTWLEVGCFVKVHFCCIAHVGSFIYTDFWLSHSCTCLLGMIKRTEFWSLREPRNRCLLFILFHWAFILRRFLSYFWLSKFLRIVGGRERQLTRDPFHSRSSIHRSSQDL